MPKIHRGEDLYRGWTRDIPGGPYTREYFLQQSLAAAISQINTVNKAKFIVDGCAEAGIVASLGPRYKNMHWMRDLAYMMPAYIQRGHKEEIIGALKTLCEKQCQEHKEVNNGYETFNNFGKMPIVCVAEKNERDFLLQRMCGTPEDPYWQLQLWNYCKHYQPETLNTFPAPANGKCDPNAHEPPSLTDCSLMELKEYYQQLLDFKNQHDQNKQAPAPSFALRCLMEDKLADITPGTRDSEIHFIRAFFQLIDSLEYGGAYGLMGDFAMPLASALFYLYTNVIDPEDGLPKGCDSRDIFADLLYDAKTLTNAVFWYEALTAVVKHATALDHIAERFIEDNEIPNPLLDMFKNRFCEGKQFSQFISEELQKLKTTINNKLLTKDGVFCPRDFIPGKNAAFRLANPIFESPSNALIQKDNPDFPSGKFVDPQSLAHAVLNGLISEENYDSVVDIFRTQDSPIGVTVFVPISGKTAKEAELLREVHGRVVWPHVSWTVVQALVAMGTPNSMAMAEQQKEKLLALRGCAEWYAADPHDGHAIQGGDPIQGWSASTLLMAMKAISGQFPKVITIKPTKGIRLCR